MSFSPSVVVDGVPYNSLTINKPLFISGESATACPLDGSVSRQVPDAPGLGENRGHSTWLRVLAAKMEFTGLDNTNIISNRLTIQSTPGVRSFRGKCIFDNECFRCSSPPLQYTVKVMPVGRGYRQVQLLLHFKLRVSMICIGIHVHI